MSSRSTASTYQEAALRALLDHAILTTDAYSKMVPGDPLSTFPVVDKNSIRQSMATMLSRSFDRSSLVTASTSGSTGTPLVVFQDKRKRLNRTAEAIYFGRMAGFQLGTRLFNLKIWSGRNQQSRWTHFLRNTQPIDVLVFRDEQIRDFIRTLQNLRSPASIIAYSSSLELLARYLDANPLHATPPIDAIIAQSEAFSEDARERLSKHMRATAVTRYGTEEVGIIGQQIDTTPDYRVNQAGVHVEILKLDEDVEASPGQLGRIVVTDLKNFAMPLIRYDTGDVGAFRIDHDGRADERFLAQVGGRALDQIFDTQDRIISSFVFYKCIWKYPAIQQFQLIQNARATYTLRLNVQAPFTDEAQILRDFTEYLGPGAIIKVDYVSEIPVLSSGKRRQVVQNYHR